MSEPAAPTRGWGRWTATRRLVMLIAGTAVACWLPFQLGRGDVGLYDRMGLYALVAIGLTLLMGFAGQVSLGQGGFFLIGAYTSGLLTVGLDPDTRLIDPEAGIDPLLALAIAPVVSAAVALLIGIPLMRLRGHYLAFATLAFALIAWSLLYAQDRFTGGQYGVTVVKRLVVGGHDITGATHAAVVWGLVGLALLLSTNLVSSRSGRALQAIAANEPAAAASGINVAMYKLKLFVYAAALAGLAGGLFTFYAQFLVVLVYRATGIVNFAQGVFAVLGGLLTYSLGQHMSLVLAAVLATLVTAFVATVVAVVAVGFRGRTTPLASLIITVGIALLAEAVLLAAFGEVPRSYSAVSDRAWDIGGVLVQPQYAVLAVVALVAALGLTLFLRRTIVGQALVASADSPRAAELIGLNLRSVAVIAFAIAGALTAVGGLLLAPTVPVTYNADLAITINGFAAAVFGGLTSIRLALLGGYALGVVEQLVVGYVDPQYNLIIALTVMLVLIGWRSRGELAI